MNGNILAEGNGALYFNGITNTGNEGAKLFHVNNNSYFDHKGSGSLLFRVDNNNSGTTRMAINSDTGNVGIGTVNPAASLDVRGSAIVGNGTNTVTVNTNSLAVGRLNTVTGINSFASGQNNTVSGDRSIACGLNNELSGTRSMIMGTGNVVVANNSFVSGINHINVVGCANLVSGSGNTI